MTYASNLDDDGNEQHCYCYWEEKKSETTDLESEREEQFLFTLPIFSNTLPHYLGRTKPLSACASSAISSLHVVTQTPPP